MNPTRVCPKCRRALPQTSEYFAWRRKRLWWRSQCRDCRRECQRASNAKGHQNRLRRLKADPAAYRAFRDKENARKREYRRKHPEQARIERARRRQRPDVKLRRRISKSIGRSIKQGKGGHSWEALVAYSLQQLKGHLQSLFSKRMSWSNYGSWQIHHVRPLSTFSMTTAAAPAVKRAWALDNLRPVWAKTNNRKQNEWDGQTRLGLS